MPTISRFLIGLASSAIHTHHKLPHPSRFVTSSQWNAKNPVCPIGWVLTTIKIQKKVQKLSADINESIQHREVEENNNMNDGLSIKTIPDTLSLSEAEKSVLRKGLIFIPIRPNTDEFTTREDCEKFYRRLRLKAFFQ